MSERTVVIGAGFLGLAAAEAAAAEGRHTVVVSRRPTPLPSCVVFAAGNSVPSADERNPRGSTNSLKPLIAVLDAVRRSLGATLFYLSSGGAVYGEPGATPIPEHHPLRPRSAYGAAKVAAENYIGYYVRRYGISATALRCGNAYGPGQVSGRGQGLIGELIDAAETGRTIEIWGDGSVRRDYVYVGDIATAIVALAGRRDLPLALNVGSGRATSVNEVVAQVSAIVGCPLRTTSAPGRSFDVHDVELDIAALRGLIEFDPVPLPEGISLTWARIASDTVA